MVLRVLLNPTFFRLSAKSVPFSATFLPKFTNITKVYQSLPNLPNLPKNIPKCTKFHQNITKCGTDTVMSQFQSIVIYMFFPLNLYPQKVRVGITITFFQLCTQLESFQSSALFMSSFKKLRKSNLSFFSSYSGILSTLKQFEQLVSF